MTTDKLTQAQSLVAEVNQEIPDGINFEFTVLELPTKRTLTDGRAYWSAYEEQGIVIDGENACMDGEPVSPIDIAYGIGAALIAAARYHESVATDQP